MVKAVAVVEETGFGVAVFRGKSVAEKAGERTIGGRNAAEGVVDVLRNDVAIGIEVACDVAIVVIARNVDCAVNGQV